MTGIYLIQGQGNLVELREEAYDSEDLLQELLASHPNLLAGDQIDSESPRRWLLARREMGVPGEEAGANRWSLDHLFLDQDAIPTFVEVKRSSDTRLRREVVGQILDYAANAMRYWPAESMRESFEERCDLEDQEPADLLSELVGEESDPEDFWARAKINLQAGRVRLLFVADVIPQELRRVIEFLNEQMDPAEVLGVEIRQYVSRDLRTLVPRVIGQTAEAQQRKRPKGGGNAGPTLRGAEEFSASIEQAPEEDREALRHLRDWALGLAEQGLTRLYTSVGRDRWVLNLRLRDEDVSLISIWNDRGAYISIHGTVFERRAPQARRKVEQLMAPTTWGQGKTVRDPGPELLEAVRGAYQEAAGPGSS